jgi:hypothetical protein
MLGAHTYSRLLASFGLSASDAVIPERFSRNKGVVCSKFDGKRPLYRYFHGQANNRALSYGLPPCFWLKMPRMRDRPAAAKKAWKTIRNKKAWEKAHAAERASKDAPRKYCKAHGWRVAFLRVRPAHRVRELLTLLPTGSTSTIPTKWSCD